MEVNIMARRKSAALSTADQLVQIEQDIAAKEQELKDLKSKRRDLLAQKKQEDLEEIYKIVVESGKSLDEVKEMLAKG